MAESDYVTIVEAAQRCGVNPKTIQRAIHRGDLSAEYPQPNRCRIAVADLERFHPASGQVPGQSVEELVGHVAALEQRIADLEEQMRDLQDRLVIAELRRRRAAHERLTGPLPRNLVSLLAFAKLHNIAEHKALAAIDLQLLPVKRGEWTDKNGQVITLALDAEGRMAFYQTHREFPMFLACKHCPHGYLDMSRQSRSDT